MLGPFQLCGRLGGAKLSGSPGVPSAPPQRSGGGHSTCPTPHHFFRSSWETALDRVQKQRVPRMPAGSGRGRFRGGPGGRASSAVSSVLLHAAMILLSVPSLGGKVFYTTHPDPATATFPDAPVNSGNRTQTSHVRPYP